MFLRLHVAGVLWRCCCRPRPPAPTALKSHYSGLPTSSFTFTSTPSSAPTTTTSRALSTTCILRKDVPQPQDEEAQQEASPKLDLDVWKSVMRTMALQEDRVKTTDKGEDEGTDKEEPTTDDSKEVEGQLSPLEATRVLVDAWRLAGRSVPDSITDEQLETLSSLPTKSGKRKYLKHLTIKENHKKVSMEKKEKKMAERMERIERASADGEGEPKVKNTFLLQYWSQSLDKLLSWRSAHAMQYGQPLVFDMSYDQHMSSQFTKNTASQLMLCEGLNRRSVDPFHLHFCNLQPNSAYHQELLKCYSQEAWERLFITATSKRHVDIFPRENLVYLTADSPNVLHTFDHNKVYIIGAFVDRSDQCRMSLANAKRLNLATARLPLDEYLQWECGGKNLTLDQMLRILTAVKETGCWEKALEFVPKRKHVGFHQQKTENRVRSKFHVPSAPGTAPFRATTTTYRGSQADGVPLFRNKKTLRNQTTGKPAFKSEQIYGQTRLRTALKSKMEEHSKAMREKKNWSNEK